MCIGAGPLPVDRPSPCEADTHTLCGTPAPVRLRERSANERLIHSICAPRIREVSLRGVRSRRGLQWRDGIEHPSPPLRNQEEMTGQQHGVGHGQHTHSTRPAPAPMSGLHNHAPLAKCPIPPGPLPFLSPRGREAGPTTPTQTAACSPPRPGSGPAPPQAWLPSSALPTTSSAAGRGRRRRAGPTSCPGRPLLPLPLSRPDHVSGKGIILLPM